MASKRDKVAVEVTWDDQRNICTFSRTHRRYSEVQSIIGRLKSDIEKITDATDEIIIADDVKYVFGETFVAVDMDLATELLESKKTSLETELADRTQELEDLQKTVDKLKVQLYAKFGSQIYLENE
eukprot:GILI01011558.1.p1 GENE.GILI01011558.1~~GILI01011558.1.p1  ORF type:complete len:126 (-),score=44.59 GILI01011558.1:81-458(-)